MLGTVGTETLGNVKYFSFVLFVRRHDVRQLGQRLLDGQRLSMLADFSLRGSAHNQLDAQRTGEHGLHLGEPAVFSQIIQIFQHKQGVGVGNGLLGLGHDLGKSDPG